MALETCIVRTVAIISGHVSSKLIAYRARQAVSIEYCTENIVRAYYSRFRTWGRFSTVNRGQDSSSPFGAEILPFGMQGARCILSGRLMFLILHIRVIARDRTPAPLHSRQLVLFQLSACGVTGVACSLGSASKASRPSEVGGVILHRSVVILVGKKKREASWPLVY